MAAGKRRVLIVNAYFDPWRSATPTQLFLPRAMAPFYLAGYFDPERVEVRVWDEVHHGALLDRRLLAWPELVVFTGLTACFDRARQLSAYIRHASPGVATAIGGPIARALPALCARVFDHVAQGDVADVAAIADDVLGPGHTVSDPAPRSDLAGPTWGLGFVETTTNCNFACSFCSLTGEARPYTSHSAASIARQIDAWPRMQVLMTLDNNFYGNDRRGFEVRTRALGERWRKGEFRGWGALVTGDFFRREANLKLMAENGCRGLFSGVESLDPAVLGRFNKKHSLASDPLSLTHACMKYGMFFDYGMMIDFTQQTVEEVASQVDGILANPEIPQPGLLSLTIPIVGTPYFDESARAGRMMPNVLLSDLDGQKLVEWPKEPLDKVLPFAADLLRMRGRKGAVAAHALRHAWHWRRHVPLEQTAIALVRPLHRSIGRLKVGTVRQMARSLREPAPTYCAMTDQPRLAYTPERWLPSRYAADFEPLRVTDANGALTDDLLGARAGGGSVPPARRQLFAAGDVEA